MIGGLKPHPPPLSSQKNEILIFGLCSTSDDRQGWFDGLKPHLPPLSSEKCKMPFFLDYVQLLVIDWAIQAMKVNRNVPKGPISNKKWKYSFL